MRNSFLGVFFKSVENWYCAICCSGDPLYDLIPIYLDVFRGELVLFKQFLESYGLPLSKASMNGWLPCTVSENLERYKRTSYRTMYVSMKLVDYVSLLVFFTFWSHCHNCLYCSSTRGQQLNSENASNRIGSNWNHQVSMSWFRMENSQLPLSVT